MKEERSLGKGEQVPPGSVSGGPVAPGRVEEGAGDPAGQGRSYWNFSLCRNKDSACSRLF